MTTTSLKERITEDMKSAMRAGEKERLGTIRMLQAAIKQREVDERITLDDAQVLAVIEKMLKQRKESIAQFEQGGRADLAAKEQAEIELLHGVPARAALRRRSRCPDQGGHRLHRCRVRQGHGQGDGDREGEGCGAGRHGRGQRPHQGGARRLIRLRAACASVGRVHHFVFWLRDLRAAQRMHDGRGRRAGFGVFLPRPERQTRAREKDPNPNLTRGA